MLFFRGYFTIFKIFLLFFPYWFGKNIYFLLSQPISELENMVNELCYVEKNSKNAKIYKLKSKWSSLT